MFCDSTDCIGVCPSTQVILLPTSKPLTYIPARDVIVRYWSVQGAFIVRPAAGNGILCYDRGSLEVDSRLDRKYRLKS